MSGDQRTGRCSAAKTADWCREHLPPSGELIIEAGLHWTTVAITGMHLYVVCLAPRIAASLMIIHCG